MSSETNLVDRIYIQATDGRELTIGKNNAGKLMIGIYSDVYAFMPLSADTARKIIDALQNTFPQLQPPPTPLPFPRVSEWGSHHVAWSFASSEYGSAGVLWNHFPIKQTDGRVERWVIDYTQRTNRFNPATEHEQLTPGSIVPNPADSLVSRAEAAARWQEHDAKMAAWEAGMAAPRSAEIDGR